MKLRDREYLKTLEIDAVKFYFKNPDKNSLEELSEMFKLNKERISNAIAKELKKRFDNSMARRFMTA
jgi:DNA-directed RNA polymerase sigma subunit (sigma70/sigma32)|tara:strand:- start:288 stop:488 length:201 start_codon:yes stop_codon:yes gene_type:complete